MGATRLHRAARLAPVLLLALAACGGGEPAGTPELARETPRNLLLISIDTLRPDHLGCYGYERPTSPTLDALAARGTRFTDVTSASPWTLPSHATMLTGLYPSHHGVKGHETRLSESVETLAEAMAGAGLTTLAVVNTWNLGARQFQLRQGFERFAHVQETLLDPATNTRRTVNRGADILERARKFLTNHVDDRFFLFLHFYDVHTDFTPGPEYVRQFVDPYEGRMNGSTRQLVKLRSMDRKLPDDDIRWLRQMYDAEIRELDDHLGVFLAWLDEQGHLEDTLVVVTSDHGEEFQEHGSFLHGRTQYEELLRIPLLMAGPGVPAGLVVDDAVHGVDVTPTLLALMGVESTYPRDGLDLTPLLAGGTLPERPLFGEADHSNTIDGEGVIDIKSMIRRGHEKLHLDDHTGLTELYDLATDPGEQVDLLEQRPERAAVLLEELKRFRAGAVAAESVPEPNSEELELLRELGYAGDGDE